MHSLHFVGSDEQLRYFAKIVILIFLTYLSLFCLVVEWGLHLTLTLPGFPFHSPVMILYVQVNTLREQSFQTQSDLDAKTKQVGQLLISVEYQYSDKI